MSHFVRASKYRHVYVEPPKTESTFSGFRLSTATGEQNYIKGNTKFFAVAVSGGGGPVAVVPYAKPGRIAPAAPTISGHTSQVLDFDFNPFHEHVIATASDDSTIKVWGIPENGLTANLTEPLVDLHGHGRKVSLIRFHPASNNVLGSVSSDLSVKIWDIEKGVEALSLDGHNDLIQDIVWNGNGSNLATSCKDKSIRIFDPRGKNLMTSVGTAHEGAKSSKLVFIPNKEKLVSVGFTRQSQRQFKIWDPRNFECGPLKTVDIDQAAGVIMPFYDQDTSLLYLAGKGDGNIRYYEMTDGAPFQFGISEYRSTTAQKGVAFIPKRGLDIMRCETARALKLTSNTVEPLKFIVPRKSDAFQDDIFPDTFSGESGQTADEWFAGGDAAAKKMSLRPGAVTGGKQAAFIAVKSAAVLTKELAAAEARIAELEKRLKGAGLSTE